MAEVVVREPGRRSVLQLFVPLQESDRRTLQLLGRLLQGADDFGERDVGGSTAGGETGRGVISYGLCHYDITQEP